MQNFLSLLVYFVILIISLSFHEMAHAIVSYILGDDTAKMQNRVSLNPFKHLDPFLSFILPLSLIVFGLPVFGGAKPVMVNSRKLKWGDYGMALVALAGPLANFLLAFICFGFATVFLKASTSSGIGQILLLATQVNLGLMLFNLIPIPPLDGSKVLYALMPESTQGVMDKLEASLLPIFIVIMLMSHLIAIYINQVSVAIIQLFRLVFPIT